MLGTWDILQLHNKRRSDTHALFHLHKYHKIYCHNSHALRGPTHYSYFHLFTWDHYSLITINYYLLESLYTNTTLRTCYVIQGHVHRLICSTLKMTQTFDPQIYPWTSSALGTTASAPLGTLIDKFEDKNGLQWDGKCDSNILNLE